MEPEGESLYCNYPLSYFLPGRNGLRGLPLSAWLHAWQWTENYKSFAQYTDGLSYPVSFYPHQRTD
jgi:hypothetical protein